MNLKDVSELEFELMLPKQRMELLRKWVCELFGVDEEVLISKRKPFEIDFPRKIYFYVAFLRCGATQVQISESLGRGEKHSNISRSVSATNNLLKTRNADFMDYWNKFTQHTQPYLIP